LQLQQQATVQVINNLPGWSRARNLGTLTVRQQLISGPPLPLYLLAPRASGSNFNFDVLTVSNQSYTVWSSTNPAASQWAAYTNRTGDGYPQTVIAPANGSRRSFYRASSP
jgi:hypothetical protein